MGRQVTMTFSLQKRPIHERLSLSGITREDIVEYLVSLKPDELRAIYREVAEYHYRDDPINVGDIVRCFDKNELNTPWLRPYLGVDLHVEAVNDDGTYRLHSGHLLWGAAPRHCLRKV